MKILFPFVLILITQFGYGQNWEPITNPTTDRINDCSFVDENTGWIITDAKIFKTTDGGQNWSGQNVPPNPVPNLERVLNSIQFINPQVGVIACGTYWINVDDLGSPVLWTTDGGETWENRDLGNTTFNLDAVLVDTMNSFTIGQYGASRKTVDGGSSWDESNFAGAYSGVKLFPISKDTIYFVGVHQFDLQGAFGRTTNGGLTWETSIVTSNGLTKAIYFHDHLKGCIGGYDGEIRCTEDGGSTWDISNSGTAGIVNDIMFTDPLNGWTVTSDGEILRTMDGGQNWTVEYSGASYLTSICMIESNSVGYAVGVNDVLKTTFTSSADDIMLTSIIRIFPNPFQDKFIVELNGIPSVTAKIEVYNLLGQLITEEKINTRKSEFEFKNLSKGTYILKVLNGDEIGVKTIVKI